MLLYEQLFFFRILNNLIPLYHQANNTVLLCQFANFTVIVYAYFIRQRIYEAKHRIGGIILPFALCQTRAVLRLVWPSILLQSARGRVATAANPVAASRLWCDVPVKQRKQFLKRL